ncbi:MAG: GntR family transcriptional regulator [Deltaproteobacteria bacterium]|nr:GntR family transcriptional regulator [Deltaproteobacteria bacterium]
MLKDGILIGKLKGGEQLLEDKLRREFDVSRTPLREAFRILEKEGLVEILPWKGAFVRKISRKDIREVFPLRANLEGLAARLAYENSPKGLVDEMAKCLEHMRLSIHESNFAEYSRHHIAFHDVFIMASQNQTLINIVLNLRICTLWHRNTYQFYEEDFGDPLKIHREIADLFMKKMVSPDDVEKMVKLHIIAALDAFLATMEKDENASP